MDYHGIIINLSLKHQSTIHSLDVIGQKNVFLNWLVLLKVCVHPQELETIIKTLQVNMVERFGFYVPHFYCHFYREDELIIVFKDRVFLVKTDPSTWHEVLSYGRSLGIPVNQLDFAPYRLEDETY